MGKKASAGDYGVLMVTAQTLVCLVELYYFRGGTYSIRSRQTRIPINVDIIHVKAFDYYILRVTVCT